MTTSEYFVQGKEDRGIKPTIYLHVLSRIRKRVPILLLPHPPPSSCCALSLSTLCRQLPRPYRAGKISVISDIFVSEIFFTLYLFGISEAVTLQALQIQICSFRGFLNNDAFRILVGKLLGKLSLWSIDKGL